MKWAFWDAWSSVDDNMVKPVGSGAIEGLRDGMGRGKKNQVSSCRGAVKLSGSRRYWGAVELSINNCRIIFFIINIENNSNN